MFRTTAGLQAARRRIEELSDEYAAAAAAPFSAYSAEAQNLLVAARFVLDGALARRENVGLHFNADLAD